MLLPGLASNSRYFFRVVSTIGTNVATLGGFTFSTAGELIVDNPDATYTGAWTVGTSAVDKYLNDYRYTGTAATSSEEAKFRPTITTPGKYDVYVWFSQGGNRATNANYVILDSFGTEAAVIDQTINGGSWQSIGTNKNFYRGTNGYVRLDNGPSQAAKVVIADAVRFVYDPRQDLGMAGEVPAWWSSFFFPTNVSAAADPDGDGYSNYAEYVGGTRPEDSSSKLQFAIENSGNSATVFFAPYYPDRFYRLQSIGSLVATNWTTLTNAPTRSGDSGVFILPAPTSGFYRLQITLIP